VSDSSQNRRPDTEDLAQACAALALDKKGVDPVIFHVSERTSYTDFFVITEAQSERQASAIARHIEDTMRRAGVKPLGVEGKHDGNWILIDFGDFIVHVFLDTARHYYDMDGLWADAAQLEVDGKRGLAVLEQLSQITLENP
jgi:ribosome-associated protein